MMQKMLYSQLFGIETGKLAGDIVAQGVSNMFSFDNSLQNGEGSYDRHYKGKRIEIKAMRALAKRERCTGTMLEMLRNCDEYKMENRALMSYKNEHIFGENPIGWNVEKIDGESSACQQVKPKNFDYMFFVNVFLDKMRVYIVPSEHINPIVSQPHDVRKITMTPQHGNPHEGVISLNKITKYYAFDIDVPLGVFEDYEINVDSYIKRSTKLL